MEQNGRTPAAAEADPRGGARAGGSPPAASLPSDPATSSSSPPAPRPPAGPSAAVHSYSGPSEQPHAMMAGAEGPNSSSGSTLAADHPPTHLDHPSPPSLARAQTSPVEPTLHQQQANEASRNASSSSSSPPLPMQPPPGLSIPGGGLEQQQLSYHEQMIQRHTLPPPQQQQHQQQHSRGDAGAGLRVNTSPGGGSTLSSSAPGYGSPLHPQRPPTSHSDMTDMTPRPSTGDPRFETPALSPPTGADDDAGSSSGGAGGGSAPFAPMPGFPAVGDLGGYPTGDGASRERPISSPSAPGLTIGMGGARESGEKRTLWLGDLEGWMDEAYLRQMCSLMGWDIVAIKLVRQPPPTNSSPTALAASPTSNNYAFITFPTAHLASRILHTLTPSPSNPPIFMPNSARPFKANWASSSTTSSNPGAVNPAMATDGPLEREFSIFVGDLAPDVTEGDLVRLFLNPPARLPADGGAPRRSFTSVRSAKIMLDPKGGGSRGYGFVRFAEEVDQLRALSEMQGVYCLSRPMRLSHATAKNRSGLGLGGSQGGSSVGAGGSSRGGTPTPLFNGAGGHDHVAGRSSPYGPSSATSDASHVNALDAASNRDGRSPVYQNRSAPSPSGERPPPPPGAIPPPERRLSPSTIEYLTQLAAANGGTLPFGPGMSLPSFPGAQQHQHPHAHHHQQPPLRHAPSVPSLHIPPHDTSAFQPRQQQQPIHYDAVSPGSNPYPLAPEPFAPSSLHVNTSLAPQQRPEPSPLSPVGGPQAGYDPAPGVPGGVNSTDPNNTTVFVGGLSSLISEETLKTFFAPFGEITYAKIPPGKGCGFVQFVRKQDAERAIERMQGFPIGGGRIRLSWGRSQYKAAQAAAQAAQLGIGLGALSGINGLNPAQISQLGIALQNLGGLGGGAGPNRGGPPGGGMNPALVGTYGRPPQGGPGQMNGGYGVGGYGPGGGMGGPPGGFGGLNVGALGGLNPQALQSLIALASTGGMGDPNALSGAGVNGGLSPALLAQLASQKDANGGFDPLSDVGGPQPNRERAPSYSNGSPPTFGGPPQQSGGSSFTPFSPAMSPVSRNSEIAGERRMPAGLDARRFTYAAPSGGYSDLDSFGVPPQTANSDDQFLVSTYSSGRVGSSPVTSERAVGGFPQSHTSASSLRNNVSFSGPSSGGGGGGGQMSPFDPDYRPTIPPLHTGSSMSSDASSRFFGGGAFSPPLTAPGVVNSDYLQQQQQFAAPRARAASASVHSGGGMHDLATDLEGMELGKGLGQGGRLGGGGGVGTGPGSGRSFGYGSFGGNLLRSQLPPASRFQAERGPSGRFDEDE